MKRLITAVRQPRSIAGFDIHPDLLVALIAGVAVAGVVPRSVFIAHLALAVWAVRSPRHAVEALTLVWLLSVLSPSISADGRDALRWLSIVVALARILMAWPRRGLGFSTTRSYLVLFTIAAATSSALSFSPSISLVKLGLFLALVLSVLIAFSVSPEPDHWNAWFLTLFAVIVIVSLAMLPLGEAFRVDARGGLRGLQGITRNSNSLGFVLAPLVAWLSISYLQRSIAGPLAAMTVLGVGAMLVLTRSRNSLLAATIGVVAALAVNRFKVHVEAPEARRLARGVVVAALIALVIAIGTGGITSIVNKFGTSPGDTLTKRSEVMQRSLDDFLESPVLGSGFALPSSEELLQTSGRVPIVGIPLSATINRVFLLTALLAWTGVVGTVLILAAFWYLWLFIARYGTLPHLALATTAFAVNLAEPALFSVGGMGLFAWLIIGWAVSDAAARRLAAEVRAPQRSLTPPLGVDPN